MKKLFTLLFLISSLCPAQQSGLAPVVDILSTIKPVGTLNSVKQEYVSVTSGSTAHLVAYSGGSPGYVSHIFYASNGCNPNTSTTVNVYLDGSGTPLISVPFQNFFLNTYNGGNINSGPSVMVSKYIGFNSLNASTFDQAHTFDMPIPFNTGIAIDVVNGSGSTCTVWSMVDYHTGVPNTWPYTRVLHCDVITNQTGIALNSTVNLANYTGGKRGRLVGEWQMIDDVPGNVTPRGASMEGDIFLYIDGSASATLQSSGTEDWYGLGFYFAGNGRGGTQSSTAAAQIQGGYVASTGEIGITYMNTTVNNATEGALRWHYSDPIYFNSGLKETWNCGDTSQVAATGTCTLYSTVFYYTEN